MQRDRHGIVRADGQCERDKTGDAEEERSQGPLRRPTHLKIVLSHRARVFTAKLAFTACACVLLIAGVHAAEPTPSRVDNDGMLVFHQAAFVQPAGWPVISGAQVATEHIGPGVEFERWRLATAGGPLTFSIARVDLHNPNVALAVGTRYDRIVGPGEPLSTMADRRAAEIGINADYFDISGNGEPTNLVLAHGIIQHAPNGRATLRIGDGNRIVMGPVSLQMRLVAPSGDGVDHRQRERLVPWHADDVVHAVVRHAKPSGRAGGARAHSGGGRPLSSATRGHRPADVLALASNRSWHRRARHRRR